MWLRLFGEAFNPAADNHRLGHWKYRVGFLERPYNTLRFTNHSHVTRTVTSVATSSLWPTAVVNGPDCKIHPSKIFFRGAERWGGNKIME